MRKVTIKHSTLWTNIGDIVVESHKINDSVYQCALFYGNCQTPHCIPVFPR